jgi:predicted metal-dependent peptidase
MAKTIKGVGKLTKARSMLLMVQPWYGVPALSLRLVPRENDPILWAMGTDGHNLFFNPDWVMDATLDEIMGVIVHEIWHIWSKHDIRRGAREHRKFNIASDYALNPIIRAAGYKLPVGALGDEYAGKAAEEIYARLPEPPKGGGGTGDGGKDWDVGHVYDNPDLAQGRSVKEVEAERNMKISNWHQSAKRAGKVPAELDRIVEEMMKARMPWREILARFVNTSACNDYDHTIPDPEYARYGVYMPSMHSEELGTIVHMGDTSGSISTDMFRIEVAEAQGMLRA